MKMFELKCKAYLKSDIEFRSSFDIISKFMSFSLFNVNKADIHTNNGYKNYTFGSFYPVEKDKVYKKDNIYQFLIRSIDINIISIFDFALRTNKNNPNFFITDIVRSVKEYKYINEMYTVTPVVISVDNSKYWSFADGDLIQLQNNLHANLEKKYNNFFGTKFRTTNNFIQLFEITNQKPQIIDIIKDGNKVKLFGNKFRIIPNSDEHSQKLAFMALACGLGEKNSFGGGFCMVRGMR